MNDTLKDELDKEISYKQLLNVFLRRKIWIASTFSVVLSSAVIFTLFEKPLYESQMQLLLESNSPELSNENINQGSQQFSRSKFEVDYATQLTLMQSDELIADVAELISQDYPDVDAGKIRSNFVITQVVQNDVNTKVFQASYIDEDRIKAQKVLEAIQKVYVQYNLDRRKKSLNQGLDSIDKDIARARKIVAETEANLERFREENNVIKPTSRAQEVVQTLDKVRAEKLAVDSQYQELKTEYDTLQSSLNLSPELTKVYFRLSESPRAQGLLTQLKETELEIAEERSKYTFITPNLSKLQDRYQQELNLLRQEVSIALAGENSRINLTTDMLLQEAERLGTKERQFIAQLIEMQTKLLGLAARREILQTKEIELQNEVDRFLSLTGEYVKLQPEVEIQRDKIKRLLQARERLSLQLERAGFNWEIIQAPQSGKQISPSLKKNLALGIILGLFSGGIVAFLRESTDNTIHDIEDIKQAINQPLLGTIPDLGKEASVNQIINSEVFQESIYLINKSIQAESRNTTLKSIAVTSIQPEEGKSILALNLAINAASLYPKVLLIDANLRRPSLHQKLNLPNKEGLSHLIISKDGKLPQPDVITVSDYQISVITAGEQVKNPIQLFSSQRMKNLANQLQKKYDLIVFDLPPIYHSDAIEASSLCDALIMVSRLDRLTKPKLNEALNTTNKLGNLIGWVVNGVELPKSKSEDY
ncbi:MAG: polysaccharide biosynthesis tyrosine autokinase [Prochloraceae cyanobacterium]|nr:polysaccharide biosynthesis tyrosine autokinase [Prochloraceae cyanobacterium]